MGDQRRIRPNRTAGAQDSGIRYPGTCTAVFGSMTLTMKAQDALAAASIRTAVTKVSSTRTHSGCAYGLTFPCMQIDNVRQVLSNTGPRPRQILGEGQA